MSESIFAIGASDLSTEDKISFIWTNIYGKKT